MGLGVVLDNIVTLPPDLLISTQRRLRNMPFVTDPYVVNSDVELAIVMPMLGVVATTYPNPYTSGMVVKSTLAATGEKSRFSRIFFADA